MTSAMKWQIKPIIDPQRLKHGYAVTPSGRSYVAAQNPGLGCTINEPQSMEGPKGYPQSGPPDGKLASAGHAQFGCLDGITAPNGQPWPATKLTAGAVARVRWYLTARHKTESWEYWITRNGWDQSAPLARAQFEPEPFGRHMWPCPQGGWTCHMPEDDVHHWVYLPEGKTGRHVIYAIWNVGDTGNAFYQVIDVDFG